MSSLEDVRTVVHIDDVPLSVNPLGLKVRQVLNTAAYRIMFITLSPGQAIQPHTSPVEVVFYVIEGSGEITIGGITHKVKARDVLPCPKEVLMSLVPGSDGLAVLNIKSPNPATLA